MAEPWNSGASLHKLVSEYQIRAKRSFLPASAMGAASSSPAVSPAAGRASKSHTFLEEVSAGGEKSASLKRAKSSRINNFGKRNSEPMADYDDEFAEAHAEFLRETMARRNSDVDVGEGRRFMEYQESAVEKVAQTEIRKAIAGPQTQQLDDDDNEAPDPSFRVRAASTAAASTGGASTAGASTVDSDCSSAVDRRSAADRRCTPSSTASTGAGCCSGGCRRRRRRT